MQKGGFGFAALKDFAKNIVTRKECRSLKKVFLKLFMVILILGISTPTTFAHNSDLSDNNNYETDNASKAAAFIERTQLTESAKEVLETTLSDEAMAFLDENNVEFTQSNQKVLERLQYLCDEVPGLYGLNQDLLSLKEDAATYDFTEIQVQKYVEGLVTTTPIIIDNRSKKIHPERSLSGPVSTGRSPDGDGGGGELPERCAISSYPLDISSLQEKEAILAYDYTDDLQNGRDLNMTKIQYISVPRNTVFTVTPKEGYSVTVSYRKDNRINDQRIPSSIPVLYDGFHFQLERSQVLVHKNDNIPTGFRYGGGEEGTSIHFTDPVTFSIPEEDGEDCIYEFCVRAQSPDYAVSGDFENIEFYCKIEEEAPVGDQYAEDHPEALERNHKTRAWIQNLKDVSENDWFYPILPGIYGVMSGVSETEFAPNQPMTRAMFATVLYRLNDETGKTTAGGKFADVPAGKWYTDAVNWAAANNIVSGVGENRFDPDSNVTREQMAVMLKNFSTYKKDTLRLRGETPPAYSSFKDVLAVSSWATDSLKWAVENGLIKGMDIGLEPQKTATRAQVAQLMYNYIASR